MKLPHLKFLLVGLLTSAAIASNPAPPAKETPDFLRGWQARGLADGTMPPPATVPTTAPSVPVVPLSADLVKVLASAKDGATLQLSAGIYTIATPATLSASHVTLLGDPHGTWIIRKSVPGTTTGIQFAGAFIEVAGITFDSDKPLAKPGTAGWNAKVSINAVRVSGTDFYIHDCSGDNVDDFVFLEATASRARLGKPGKATDPFDLVTGPGLRGDAVYIEGTDTVTVRIKIVNSQEEHGVRTETHDGINPPKNITIAGCDIANSDGKESIAMRWGQNVAVTGNILRAWARVNQGVTNPLKPNKCCGNVTFTANIFTVGSYITINPYTPATVIHGNTFNLDASHIAVNVQGPAAECDIAANVKAPTPAGTKLKPLIHSFGQVQLTGSDASDVNKSP